MSSGKILVIRSQDGESTFIETIPATRGEQKALILNDDEVAYLLQQLSAYHNGEIRKIVFEVNLQANKVTR